jgi:hypothetical protein
MPDLISSWEQPIVKKLNLNAKASPKAAAIPKCSTTKAKMKSTHTGISSSATALTAGVSKDMDDAIESMANQEPVYKLGQDS